MAKMEPGDAADCSLTVVQVRVDGSKKRVAFAGSGHIPIR
jgi:hypothetical protein